jgi:pullulanase
MLAASQQFDPEAGPTNYIQNHDHRAFMLVASADRNEWWRMQPYLIALFTCPGAVLVHNGQEYANSYDMPEDGAGRVVPRPIDWGAIRDGVGDSVAQVLSRLASIRAAHAALRAPNFHPPAWDENRTARDADGFGLDVGAQVCVYHRWSTRNGQTERIYVVLNFSDDPGGRSVDFKVAVPDASWTDLLTGDVLTGAGNDMTVLVGRCWGRVLCRVD